MAEVVPPIPPEMLFAVPVQGQDSAVRSVAAMTDELIEAAAQGLVSAATDGVAIIHPESRAAWAREVLAAAFAYRDASGGRVVYLAGELEQVVMFDPESFEWLAVFRLRSLQGEPEPR